MKPYLIFIIFYCCACSLQQESHHVMRKHSIGEPEDSPLYITIAGLDAEVFEKGFNQCDLQVLREYTAEDFEFYHDQAGTNRSKQSFVQSIATHVCSNDYKAFRKLVAKSLKVFPLYRNNKLYGAIQTAEHQFYAEYSNKQKLLTDTAKLITLWIKEEENWKMYRSFSYDHISYE